MAGARTVGKTIPSDKSGKKPQEVGDETMVKKIKK